MYALKSDPQSGIFFLRNSRCGAERIYVLAKTHGLLRSGFSALTMTRIGAERIIRTNLLSRIRTDFPRMSRSGSEQISARRESHGLSQSGYPPLGNVADRCGLGNPLRNNPDYGLYSNPYTSLLFPTTCRMITLQSNTWNHTRVLRGVQGIGARE